MDCNNLIHPFQKDPGVSQSQRRVEDLLSGAAKIDGRTMADILDYFAQLSSHINYYDTSLHVSDWQPFFEKSIPFTLASIIKYKRKSVVERFNKYDKLFDRHPSHQSLQLILNYFFYSSINRINSWYIQVKGTGLPVEQVLERLIRDKLSVPLKKIICLSNIALEKYCVKRISLSKIKANDIWNLQETDLLSTDCLVKGRTKRARLKTLKNQLKDLFPVFQDAVTVIAASAEMSMEQSMIPLKEELQMQHPPHLALLFAFLKLFNYLQEDLNSYSRKHLDFFYKEVLKIKPREANPDRAHLILEIQKQLDKYLLKKGLLAKDGKDDNKEEIYFGLDDEIVVNKTQVADTRSLFLNNKTFYDATYLEGLYMAPDATKADGIDQDFADEPKYYPTVGAKLSKYVLPETRIFKPYPNARLGFILASPVLLLNEGRRSVDITLACRFENNHCANMEEPESAAPNPCCEPRTQDAETRKEIVDCGPKFIPSKNFYSKVNEVLQNEYYYISEELVQKSTKKGIAQDLVDRLRKLIISPSKPLCYCPGEKPSYDKVVLAADFPFNDAEKEILLEFFKPRRAFKILFSGEKDWVEPSIDNNLVQTIELLPDPLPANSFKFLLHINVVLNQDKPAVTFFNKDVLKEDLEITLPVVKIELDDAIKIILTNAELEQIAHSLPSDVNDCCPDNRNCCVLKDPMASTDHPVSLYHFFRNVFMDKGENDKTKISVEVCGLKKFIVQNDEALQDVKTPIYPFGTRPNIVDFDIVNPSVCITQQFINDAVGLSVAGKNFLKDLLNPANGNRVRIAKSTLNKFLQNFSIADQNILQVRFNDKTKNYCDDNLAGPNFFIGSSEVFFKKWDEVYVNINWKDKPGDFRDYYKGYVAMIDPNDPSKYIYGLDKEEFQINLSILEKGKWVSEKLNPPHTTTVFNHITKTNNRKLFNSDAPAGFCNPGNGFEQTIRLFHDEILPDPQFDLTQRFDIANEPLKAYEAGTFGGFMRITLMNQDFLHKDYAYVLGRQMMALGKLPDIKIDDATYYDENGGVIVFSTNLISAQVQASETVAIKVENDINGPGQIKARAGAPGSGNISSANAQAIRQIILPPPPPLVGTMPGGKNLTGDVIFVKNSLTAIKALIDANKKFQAIIPNEPWTPIIKEISLDYKATAPITDITLIHLHPFKDTYRREEISTGPTLFPTFCDEGNLFLGLKYLVPGNRLNILFQLAEATSDSETEREKLRWYYLDNNQWKRLRTGFEVLEDATDGLTTSGIVKFSLPANMTKGNSVMPKEFHWIRASIKEKSRSVSETIGIHTQAISVTFTNEKGNDKLRLSKPLESGKISKLKEADANVKKISQPYEGFGGRVPEIEGQYYVRVSELLRHKGRAIQKFDYERMALDKFPQLFKVKCINHSFALDASHFKNDFPIAPGYVVLAVVPDLNQLKAGKSFEPRVPVSLLEKIKDWLHLRTSPFVRLRVMNPRYEKINFCLKIKLHNGRDQNYYKEKLTQDLREFLAPWAIGEYDKLNFGQCVNRSDIIRFLEGRDYVDFIIELAMGHEYDRKKTGDPGVLPGDVGDPKVFPDLVEICPKTARSILIAGDIDVCIKQNECEDWGEGDCSNEKLKLIDYCND